MFRWRPLWARYLVMCAIGLLVMLVTTERSTLEIPLCPRCTKRWSGARAAQIAAIAGIVIGFVTFNVMGSPHMRLGLAIFLSTIAVYFVTTFTLVRTRMLRASAIDPKEIALLGTHPTAVEEILAGSLSAPQLPPAPISAS